MILAPQGRTADSLQPGTPPRPSHSGWMKARILSCPDGIAATSPPSFEAITSVLRLAKRCRRCSHGEVLLLIVGPWSAGADYPLIFLSCPSHSAGVSLKYGEFRLCSG